MADGRDFGKIINNRRLELGYSLGQLANRMGTTASKVRSWERDQSVPDAEVVSQLATELNIDPKTLTEALEKPEPKTKASSNAPSSGEATAAVVAPVFSDASHTAAAIADDATPPPVETKPKPDDKTVKATPTTATPKPAAVADKPSDTDSAVGPTKADAKSEADEPDALGSVPIVAAAAATAGASTAVDKTADEPKAAAAPPADDATAAKEATAAPKAADTAKAMDNAKTAAAAAAEDATAAPKAADTAKAMDNAKTAAAAAAATAATGAAVSDHADEPAAPAIPTASASKTPKTDAEPKQAVAPAGAADGAKAATDTEADDPKVEGDAGADAPTAVVVAAAATAGAAVADADKSRLADIPTEAVPVVTAPTPEPSTAGAVMAPPMVATSAPPIQPVPPAEPTGPFAPIERAARTIFDPDRKYLFWIRVVLTLLLFLVFFRVLIWAVPEFFDALNEIIDTIESTPTDTTSFIQGN